MLGSQLPLETFPAWAALNDVSFPSDNVTLQKIEGKGFGLATNKAVSNETALLQIPRDLVLSLEAVDEYAKVDHNFKQLLQACGRQTTRRSILLYLLNHAVLSTRGATSSRRGASTPWTEYIRYIPRLIPVPTMWAEEEQNLLQGTSLEVALNAKLSVLNNEFEELREKSSELPYWNTLLWESNSVGIDDWVLVDAWYRSRCLELPQAGDSMVPVLDMANHSQDPTAYYEEDNEGTIHLRLKPGCTLSAEEEITISYGHAKSAAEMLFSYGFIDTDTAKHEMTLQLDPIPDDPLGKAKLHIFGKPPTLKILETDDGIEWDCPFAFLVCLNEEDGLDFRVLQDQEGNRQLKLFWQEEDVTDQSAEFGSLIKDHPLCLIITLRVVTILHQRVASQLESLRSKALDTGANPPGDGGQLYMDHLRNTQILRDIETRVLEKSCEALEKQSSELLEDERVKAYLQGDPDNEVPSPPQVDDDFS